MIAIKEKKIVGLTRCRCCGVKKPTAEIKQRKCQDCQNIDRRSDGMLACKKCSTRVPSNQIVSGRCPRCQPRSARGFSKCCVCRNEVETWRIVSRRCPACQPTSAWPTCNGCHRKLKPRKGGSASECHHCQDSQRKRTCSCGAKFPRCENGKYPSKCPECRKVAPPKIVYYKNVKPYRCKGCGWTVEKSPCVICDCEKAKAERGASPNQ